MRKESGKMPIVVVIAAIVALGAGTAVAVPIAAGLNVSQFDTHLFSVYAKVVGGEAAVVEADGEKTEIPAAAFGRLVTMMRQTSYMSMPFKPDAARLDATYDVKVTVGNSSLYIAGDVGDEHVDYMIFVFNGRAAYFRCERMAAVKRARHALLDPLE